MAKCGILCPKTPLLTEKQLHVIHFFVATRNVCPLAIPESCAQNMGLRLLENHSLVVQSNLHTLVILSFTEEFRTIFQLRQKELEKLNRTTRRSIEFESCRFCKRTSWFLTIEITKLCVYSAFRTSDLIKATHPRRPEEGSVVKYFGDNDSAGQ